MNNLNTTAHQLTSLRACTVSSARQPFSAMLRADLVCSIPFTRVSQIPLYSFVQRESEKKLNYSNYAAKTKQDVFKMLYNLLACQEFDRRRILRWLLSAFRWEAYLYLIFCIVCTLWDTLKDRSCTSVICMHSVGFLQKGTQLVSVVQLVSVKICPSAPGREDIYPQTLLVLGRLCIVLMEKSFYYNPFWRVRTSVGQNGFCFYCVPYSLTLPVHGHFADGQFADRTVRRQYSSPTGCFADKTVGL